MIDVGVAIFTYNRSEHFRKVLDGFKKNEIHHKVYIFQDGIKNDQDLIQHNNIKKIIDEIDWMEFEYNCFEYNKGCSKSIEDGIDYVLARHEAVVILEDDCIPLPDFMSYMDLCLDNYKENQKVIGIGGFAWNLDIDMNKVIEDVYVSGRTSSWGWGTWKDRWAGYKRDFDILKRIYFDQAASERLGIWGDDLEDMLCATLGCRTDAWDVFWCLHAIEEDKVFILPYKSFIDNIGTDGTGTNCGVTDELKPQYFADKKKDFKLIENCNPTLEIKMALAPVWNGYGHYPEYKDENCKKAIIWGVGRYYRNHKKEILKKYDVQAFIDRKKIKYFEGKPVIDCEAISAYEYDFIVIMFHNKEEAARMKENLTVQYGIEREKIIIWEEGDIFQ